MIHIDQRGFDRVGVGYHDHQVAGMAGHHGVEGGDHAGLHRGEGLAAGKRGPRRGALHNLPQVGLGQVSELLTGPLPVVGLDDALEGLDLEAVVVRDRLSGLGGPLDWAGVHRSDRELRQPAPECLGLAAPLVGEVDTRLAPREQRPGLGGHRVAGQNQTGRRRPGGVGGRGGCWRRGRGSVRHRRRSYRRVRRSPVGGATRAVVGAGGRRRRASNPGTRPAIHGPAG